MQTQSILTRSSIWAALLLALYTTACSANAEVDKTKMVLIPAGKFLTGGGIDFQKNEKVPVRPVDLGTFWIDRFEVSVASYRDCVNAGGCDSSQLLSRDEGPFMPVVAASDDTSPNASAPEPPAHCTWSETGNNDYPINCVTWQEASKYCRWAGKRLPSAFEWEKAAGGTDGRQYPWGNTAPTCSYAVMNDGGSGCKTGNPLPIGSRPKGASPYGVFDMQGNVSEWVADSDMSVISTFLLLRPELGLWRTVKYLIEIGPRRLHFGGYFAEDASSMRRIRDRIADPPDARQHEVGFRCAL
jgi:formylglycine-generating enzyme required for sulfatase activity